MGFSKLFIDRPILAGVISVMIMLVGAVAYFALPISQYPEVAPPSITVTASYPGANAETVSGTVAAPLEQEINGVENMLYISSQSTADGRTTITVTFALGTDLDTAQVLVQNRVNIALPRLPEEVRRLGEATPRSVDVRVVAATHRDLAGMVRDKSFREDLYYRLRVAVVELPPLRERGGDVVLLAEHFLARTSRGKRPCRLSRPARERLLAHRWPGNVRELENVLEVATALAEGGTIEREHLELPESRPAPTGSYHQQVETFRRRLVEEALRAAGGNRAEAARRLGLTRQALSYLVRQLRIMEP